MMVVVVVACCCMVTYMWLFGFTCMVIWEIWLPVVWFSYNHITRILLGQLWSLSWVSCWLGLELFDLVAIFPGVP